MSISASSVTLAAWSSSPVKSGVIFPVGWTSQLSGVVQLGPWVPHGKDGLPGPHYSARSGA